MKYQDMPGVGEYRNIAAVLAQNTEAVALYLLGKPVTRSRSEWRWGKPDNPGLKVTLSGPYRGRYVDHCDGSHGDMLGLAAAVRFGGDQRAAMAWARAFLNLPEGATLPTIAHRPPAPPQRPRTASETAVIAARIWREGVAPAGTPVEAYLATRGLRLEPGAPIRYHPHGRRDGERWPMMLALMTNPASGKPCGVHRTFLQADGGGKAPGRARGMLGHAGVVRLTPDAEVTMALGIAEGIETALSVAQHFGWRPVWAATGASGISGFPLLHGIEALTVFADGDAAGQEAARACADRWEGAGREACIIMPPTGLDMNDLCRGIAA